MNGGYSHLAAGCRQGASK